MAETTLEAPPASQEESHRQAGLSKWMAGLQEALPNPLLGAAEAPPAEPPPVEPPPEEPPPQPQPKTAALPVPPAQPPAAPPAAPAAEGEERWPRSAKEWKNFTSQRKAKDAEYEKTIADRDAKIKDLETKASAPINPEVQKQIDGLKKENDEYSKQLRLLAVTTHPKWKSYFGSRTNTALAQLKSCVAADQLETVTKLVQAPDSDAKEEAINAVMQSMTTLQRTRLTGVMNALEAIDVEKETEIARASQDYEQMMAQAKTEQEQRHAGFTKLLDDTVKGMQDAKGGRPEYQLREGETEWNTSVAKRIESGRKLITGNLPPEVMFKAAFDAAAYPDVLAGYKIALAEIDKLKKQVAAMTAANPRVESPKGREAGNGVPSLPKEARPMDYTNQWVKKFGEAMRGESA